MFLHGDLAGPVVLVAGDEVPEGFEVGAHLLADTKPDETEDEGGVADESGDPQPEPTKAPAQRASRGAKA